jgi:SAM-dependent methyltransferase
MGERFQSLQRTDFIKNVCQGRKVLHLGCTNYPYTQDSIETNMLLHLELEGLAKELYGLDFDQNGINILEQAGVKNLYQADLENLKEVGLEEQFDIILAGEMIEHLSNPGLFLQGIKRFMNAESKLVVTTINAYCAMRFIIYALRGAGGPNEPVHPDHVSYYSYKTLKLLLERNGFTINAFHFYDVGREHRPFARRIYLLANDISVRLFPQLSDGVIAVATLNRS